MIETNTTLPEEEEGTLIALPEALSTLRSGEWLPLDASDEVAEHISQFYWQGPAPPAKWEVARLSGAVYLYREVEARWSVVAKYYQVKKGAEALAYAEREMERIEEACSYGLLAGDLRSIRGLGAWKGVLFLEHVPGLNLADVIATRVSLPGQLRAGLKAVGRLLSTLHTGAQQADQVPDFEAALRDDRGYLKDLSKHGVLKAEPGIVVGLNELFEKWVADDGMNSYFPTQIHGDATTTNFMFPEEGRVVAIDWERMKTADPAADVGRLNAELSHSVRKHGGDSEEADAYIETCFEAYLENSGTGFDAESFQRRAKFYEGTSLLRIARNGWVPRLERMTMIAQAMAVLGS